MFKNMVEELGKKNIKKVRGYWRPDSSNFKAYNEALEKEIKTPEFETFTGRMAKELGFTNSDFVTDNDGLVHINYI